MELIYNRQKHLIEISDCDLLRIKQNVFGIVRKSILLFQIERMITDGEKSILCSRDYTFKTL